MTDRSEFVFDTKHDRYPVAVHVFLTDIHGRILLMRRAGSGFADGQLGLPAGHIDCGETPTECEVREELGITLDPAALRPAGTMFRRSEEPRLDIFFTASTWVGQPEIREPHKCTELVWAELVWADPEDALDFLGQACSDARTGQVFREYGCAEMTGSLENTGVNSTNRRRGGHTPTRSRAASHPVHPTL